jgi:hypothetical protein
MDTNVQLSRQFFSRYNLAYFPQVYRRPQTINYFSSGSLEPIVRAQNGKRST